MFYKLFPKHDYDLGGADSAVAEENAEKTDEEKRSEAPQGQVLLMPSYLRFYRLLLNLYQTEKTLFRFVIYENNPKSSSTHRKHKISNSDGLLKTKDKFIKHKDFVLDSISN